MQSNRFPTMLALLISFMPMLAGTASAAELDKYGGTTAIKGEATGFFHMEEIDGRNWFITPDGNAFFAVALSHMLSGESDLACQNVYGGDADAWLKGSFEKARAMGFNCALGSATSPERNLNGFVDVPKAEKLFREANFPFAVGRDPAEAPVGICRWRNATGYFPSRLRATDSLASSRGVPSLQG